LQDITTVVHASFIILQHVMDKMQEMYMNVNRKAVAE